MQHIEFLHSDHFDTNYHRIPPPPSLARFIDFFWETRFDNLWKDHPKGFSDAQFPNIGYTYIINLGTPFVMQVNDRKHNLKTDGFLPRNNAIECFHKPGNHLFGIKFRISPVILQKKINFSEYRGYVFPLSYLLDQHIIDNVKRMPSFERRVTVLSTYFWELINDKSDAGERAVKIVSSIMDRVFQQNDFTLSLEKEAEQNNISTRTLQRYFEKCTGTATKEAIQLMRIRKALTNLVYSPNTFDFTMFGYYDYSHFFKHAKQFLSSTTVTHPDHHKRILALAHKDV